MPGGSGRNQGSTKWGRKEYEQETLIDAPGAQVPSEARGRETVHSPGLTTVYAPPAGSRVDLDIIFIHDIHSFSHTAWMTSWLRPEKEEVFWPATLLPEREPKSVPPSVWPRAIRIKTYGYEARDSGRLTPIGHLGSQLLSVLLEDDDLAKCASGIVLVCEKIGGLVAKAAFTSMVKDQMEHKILESRFASVIFFETMHWARAREKNSSELLYELYEPQYLTLPNVRAPTWGARLDWKFQTETLPFDIFSIFYSDDKKVAEYGGGVVMGLINETPIRLSRPEDENISINREAYGAIFDCLAQTAYRRMKDILSMERITWDDGAERLKVVAEYLDQGPGDAPEDQLKALSAARVPGMTEWLLEEDDFIQWRDGDPRKRMIWITGPSGWGKTHLAAFVVNYLRGSGYDTHAYFFPFDDTRLQTAQACLLSLAYQRASISTTFQHALIRIKNALGDLDGLEIDVLAKRLWQAGILQDLSDETFFIIDGLDACAKPNVLLDTILQWCSSTNLRVLILSHVVESMEVPDTVVIPMQPKHARYTVGAMLANHAQIVSESASQALTALIRRLTHQSLIRSPLWASLVIDRLNKCHSDADFHHTLLSLPETAELFYTEALQSIRANGGDAVNSMLDIVVVLNWPVEVRSLARKVSFPVVDAILANPMFPACNGLLELDSLGRLRFSHKVARDVVRDRISAPLGTLGELESAHYLLCQFTRLSYMIIKPSEIQTMRSKTSFSVTFKTYALLNFPYHLAACETNARSALPWVKKFLQVNMVLWVHFLTRKGTHYLLQAAKHLRTFYDHCSEEVDLTTRESIALHLVLVFINSAGDNASLNTRAGRDLVDVSVMDAVIAQSQRT